MLASQKLSPDLPRFPTIPCKLSLELMGRVANEIHRIARDANRCHLPLRMAEVNSASSGGKNGVSNVFAAALWGADYSFTLAEQGAADLNFHGGFYCSGYTPICASHGHSFAQPLYYGMLLFHAATPGRVVPASVRTHANVAVHGVVSGDGTMRLVLIDKEGLDRVDVTVSGLAHYSRATVLRLVAPSFDSRTAITFGGRTVDLNGSWEPEPAERVEAKGGAFLLQLPASSVVRPTFLYIWRPW